MEASLVFDVEAKYSCNFLFRNRKIFEKYFIQDSQFLDFSAQK